MFFFVEFVNKIVIIKLMFFYFISVRDGCIFFDRKSYGIFEMKYSWEMSMIVFIMVVFDLFLDKVFLFRMRDIILVIGDGNCFYYYCDLLFVLKGGVVIY